MTDTAQERAAARLESYTTRAVAVLVLYWLFWIPGLVANLVFYYEAKRAERLAGQCLPGVGCLGIMLLLNLLLLVAALLALGFFLSSIRITHGA